MNRNILKDIRKCFIILGIIIFIIIGFIIVNTYINKTRKRSFRPMKDSDWYAYQFEKIETDNEYVYITGWFFELGNYRNQKREIKQNTNFQILLYNYTDYDTVDYSNIYICPSVEIYYQKRNDINEYFRCEQDYSNSGFIAKIDKKELNYENDNYQLVIKINEDELDGIMTNTYICKGEMLYVNPKDMVSLDVAGTDIEKIVRDGKCMASRPEFHVYIYQYGWNLYWITDEGYSFEEDDSTVIQYRLETTQFDKLPKIWQDQGWFLSNIGDDFEKYELTSKMNCGKYRVAERSIPTDYAITRIATGYCIDNNWIWQAFIRPDYLQR